MIVQVDLAERFDVQQSNSDGLAILYPRVARIEPGARQTVSVTWRGSMDRSHYYFARINSVSESELQKDRSNKKPASLSVKVGQAFPIHIEAPETRPAIALANNNGQFTISNQGQRGDHIEALRLGNGQLLAFKHFIVPGQVVAAPAGLRQGITAVKLRRFGWAPLSGTY